MFIYFSSQKRSIESQIRPNQGANYSRGRETSGVVKAPPDTDKSFYYSLIPSRHGRISLKAIIRAIAGDVDGRIFQTLEMCFRMLYALVSSAYDESDLSLCTRRPRATSQVSSTRIVRQWSLCCNPRERQSAAAVWSPKAESLSLFGYNLTSNQNLILLNWLTFFGVDHVELLGLNLHIQPLACPF